MDKIQYFIEYNNLNFNLKEVISLCKELTQNYDSSHDLNHHILVAINAINISSSFDKQNNSFYEIMLYSALLHDTVDFKYIKLDPLKMHRLKAFLSSHVQKDMEYILWIIDNISYRKEKLNGYPTHEFKFVEFIRNIVSDADRIEACKIQRALDFTRRRCPDLKQWDLFKEVIKHCYEKLLHLPYNMATEKGKEMALNEVQDIENFITSFETMNKYAFDKYILSDKDKSDFKENYGSIVIQIDK